MIKTKRPSPKREMIKSIEPKQFKNITIGIMIYLVACLGLGTLERNMGKKITPKLLKTNEVNAQAVISPKTDKNATKSIVEPKKAITMIKVEVEKPIIKLKNGNAEQNEAVEYLWNKTKNIDMILTFYGESYLLKDVVNRNTNGTQDRFFCQLNSQYHAAFISEVEKEKVSDGKILDYCIEVWNDGIKKGRIHSTFYAYSHRYDKRVRGAFYINQAAYNEFYKSVK